MSSTNQTLHAGPPDYEKLLQAHLKNKNFKSPTKMATFITDSRIWYVKLSLSCMFNPLIKSC